jgi:hypothetical protein
MPAPTNLKMGGGSSKGTQRTAKTKETCHAKLRKVLGIQFEDFFPDYILSTISANKIQIVARLAELAVTKGLYTAVLRA